MFRMFGLVVVLQYCAADPALGPLYGARGANRVTACVGAGGGARGCDAAAWDRAWAVARDGCLRGARSDDLYIWRGDVNCSDTSGEKTMYNIVVAQHKPPHAEDLVLLQLKWPYPEGDPLTNNTTGGLLEKLNNYVNEISQNAAREKDMYYHYQYMKINSSPIKLFLVTVVLPSAVFIVFFFFIIFFTGSNKDKVSYRPLLDLSEKESTI